MATEEVSPGTSGSASPASQPWASFFRPHLIVLLLVLVFMGSVRVRLADMPLERDEGEYAYAGQLILEGVPPYQLVYNSKLPGTYAAYAVILRLFGQTGRDIHLALLLINAACALLLYWLTKRLFGDLAALIAASSFALLSAHQAFYGLAAHATHFVVLFALAGLILLLRAEEKKTSASFFWCGLAFGIAYLMKQQGILLGVFAFGYLAVRTRPAERSGQAGWVRNLGMFLLAAALPFIGTCLMLYRAGVFRAFWFWTFTYARAYVSTTSLSQGWDNFSGAFSYMLYFMPWLLALALLGLFFVVFHAPLRRRHGAFVVGLFVFSFATASVGFYFRQHYFIPWLPAVSILIALAVLSSMDVLEQMGMSRLFRVLPVVVFALAWLLAIQKNADFFFHLSPFRATRMAYPANPFPEAEKVADYLRAHTSPADKVMVLGSEPEIYFEAHRKSASGYIYTYSLVEDQPYWSTMQKQMEDEIVANKPAYLVFVNVPYSWHFRPGSPQIEQMGAWINQYLQIGFEQVGVVELADPESRYYWDDASKGHPQSRLSMQVFKRKQ